MKYFDVIILGCGASGAMCALTAKSGSVAMIDCCGKFAKKILATGNGRCNLTNLNMYSSFFNHNIDKFLSKFGATDTLHFFENLGLEWFADDEKRVYPISNSAKSVVDVLNLGLDKDISLFLDEKIEKISCKGNGYCVKTSKDEYECLKLVVATGGNSTNLLENLNVEIANASPSLVSLKANVSKELNGVRISNVVVTATNFDGKSKSEVGEVLFRENGLSGIVVFNLSTLFSRGHNFCGKISIDLLPEIPYEILFEKLKKRRGLNVKVDKFFVGVFQNVVADEIFKRSHIDTNKFVNKMTDIELKELANIIKNLNFDVLGCGENNQVFSGGVKLSCLDENLMSLNHKNLFFCGEIVDVDGVCGGYNLQWAWTSGRIVGERL